MNLNTLSQIVIDKINEFRGTSALSDLLAVDNTNLFKDVYFDEVIIECNLQIDNVEETKENLTSELMNQFNNKESSDIMKSLLKSEVTHIDARVFEVEDILRVVIELFYFYVELEPIGPMIDGDLVLSGSCINERYGPAFCTIEYSSNSTSNYEEIAIIPPWSFILTPSDNIDRPSQFVIPIQLSEEYRNDSTGIVRMVLYLGDITSNDNNNIPYDVEDSNYDMKSQEKRNAYIKAIQVTKEVVSVSSSILIDETNPAMEPVEPPLLDENMNSDSNEVNELNISSNDLEQQPQLSPGGEEIKQHSPGKESTAEHEYAADVEMLQQSDNIIVDIKVASDYDDVLALQAEGYELLCTQITPKGPESDHDHLWKFHVMAKHGPPGNTGLEDIIWIKCLKSLGTLPSIPLFNIIHDYDLGDEEDDYSIYIAYKIGPNARFKRLVMLSSHIEHEDLLAKYTHAFNAVFRPAPGSISKVVGGPCGLFLMVDGHPDVNTAEEEKMKMNESLGYANNDDDNNSIHSKNSKTSITKKNKHKNQMDETRNVVDDDASVGSSVDSIEDEEDWEANLNMELEELEKEKDSLLYLNSELQKKSVMLLVREKAMQGQTAAARTAAEVVNTAPTGDEKPETTNTNNALENNNEKDKQYHETLLLIVEERAKLSKQLKEFDQLALDLQTRLDDKELKANTISSSFKQFKKEILLKSENSRTGQIITQAQILQFEQSEQKHEEDLEKVRLRNISLRTTFRKLERTLRSREQLAEGLHMIDFEQLKIENQTLNEKIEERNEELSKLKRKKTTTVQVLTHVREKLRFLEQVNEDLAQKLAQLESNITYLRSIVTADKLTRDALRAENKELKARQGFASSDLLLVDYESRCNKVEALKAATMELKERYAILKRQVDKAQHSSSSPWVMSNSLLK